MADSQIDVVSRLLQEPYSRIMQEEYDRIQASHRFRRKLEGIENEVTWFNGKSNRYWTEDRQGFFRHFQKNYGSRAFRAEPVYRSITSYRLGEEPEIVYFMILLVKKAKERAQFASEHRDIREIQRDEALRSRQMRLRNEYRLLEALLKQLEKQVLAVEASIAELFQADLLGNAENMPLPVLMERFTRSLAMPDPDQPLKLLELIRKAGGGDDGYMELLANFHAHKYEDVIRCAGSLPERADDAQMTGLLVAESCAKLGRVKEFVERFGTLDSSRIETPQMIYLLQELISHAAYSELDQDSFYDAMSGIISRKYKTAENSRYSILTARNYISYLCEGLPIASELVSISSEKGEAAMPLDKLDRLYQLQMALDLYSSEDISTLVDLDTIREQGTRLYR